MNKYEELAIKLMEAHQKYASSMWDKDVINQIFQEVPISGNKNSENSLDKLKNEQKEIYLELPNTGAITGTQRI